MNTASRLLAVGLLWLAGIAAQATASADGPVVFPLAQSAQLTVRASMNDEWLTLSILRPGGQTPLVIKDVTVSVAGHVIPAKARSDGTIVLPVKQLGTTTTPTIDIIVGHDGIREILSGKVTLPQSAAPVTSGSGHNQMVWWVVNIVILFVVALWFTNRKKKPEAGGE